MGRITKKIFVLLPVIVLGFLYLNDHHETYRHITRKRLLFFVISLLLFYGWILLEVWVRKQQNFFQVAIQAGFFVYIFMVLTLTGYFILFREVSAHNWWHKMMLRVERNDHVNLQLFKIFRIYELFSKQIVGNFVLLLPLGIFLPVLYKNLSNFIQVLSICLIASTGIELVQLITSFRSADVDDIFLNTSGACVGFVIFKLISSVIKPVSPSESVTLVNT